jgi:hypothetical protein
MLAHRVSAQSSWRPHYGLQLPEEERGHISGEAVQCLGRDPPDIDGAYTLSMAVMHRSKIAHTRSCVLKCGVMALIWSRELNTIMMVMPTMRISFITTAGPTTAVKFARDVSDGGYTASIRQRSPRSAQRFGRISRNAIRGHDGERKEGVEEDPKL